MKRAFQIPLTLAALAAFVAFGLLYRPAVRHPAGFHGMDRAAFHGKAVAAAREFLGYDVSQWQWKAKTDFRQYLFLWQQKYASTPFDLLSTPLETQATFSDPSGDHDVMVAAASNGRIVGIRQNFRGSHPKRPALEQAELKEHAQQALRLLTGEYAERFEAEETASSHEYRWHAAAGPANTLAWEVVVKLDRHTLREAAIRPRVAASESQSYKRELLGLGESGEVIYRILLVTGAVLVVIGSIFGWMRGQVDYRSALTAGGLYFAALLVSRIWGEEAVTAGAPGFGAIFPMLLFAYVYFAAFAAGLGSARELEWRHWYAMRLFLQRRWSSRHVGMAVSRGLLWSGMLALIPAAVVAWGQYPAARIAPWRDALAMLAPFPAASAAYPPFEMLSTALFVVLLPFVSKRIGLGWVSALVFFGAALGIVFAASPFATSPAAALEAAGLWLAAALMVYWRCGVLGVLSAAKGSAVLWTAAAFLQSGSESVHTSGVVLLGGFGGIWVVSLVVWRVGRKIEPEDVVAAQYLSQREKLKAEFSLAQEAQQRMLPTKPPVVRGFSIAGACQPARDVGGDLYEYFQLPDGRTGFCVADVSGKGMPAALYMTLTKGLLAAASPESADVAELAGHLNRHLYVACKRKMFVTAVLAALDAENGSVEMVRAGHNPALWYQAASGKAGFVNPPGIGLGMCGWQLFERSAKAGLMVLAPGDILVMYSDGVTEAMNEKLELYGEERLKLAVERAANGNAARVLEEIRNDLDEFTGAEPAHDDVTLLVVEAEKG
ncbi:MAG: PP2C family protein-serine/threonine phosphatase [Bryobacterales bacterium]|nr:PP2C family protein-serine/threonine phosphatase [Bryobacterales bacterium]